MRIGKVAERSGVSVETLRYYERRGLLPQPARSVGGHREYGDEAVRFVRAVKEAQGLGFTLAEIEAYLRLSRRSPHEAGRESRARLTGKIDDIDSQVEQLRAMRTGLARALDELWDSPERSTSNAAYLARRGRDPELPLGEPLHVTNGESAARTLRETSIAGVVLPWNDSLHAGPLAFAPDASRRVRAEFLAAQGWGDEDAIRHELERRDDLFDRVVEEQGTVVLWFEHDLFDQLQLLQILARLAEADTPVELVQAGVYLGSLTAPALEELYGTRSSVDAATRELARDVWRSVCDGSFESFLDRDTHALPYLDAALRRLREEREAPLSRTKRQLLRALADGAATPLEAFRLSQEMEEAVFLGDSWAFRELHELAEQGLVSPLPPPMGDSEHFATVHVELTSRGRRLLH